MVLWSITKDRPIELRDMVLKQFECGQYGLSVRVTEWTSDGKPEQLECYRPEPVPRKPDWLTM